MIESMDLNNKIIITTAEQKESVLKKINGMELLNVKVLTIDEVRKKFYFDYDERAIYYLVNKYNYTLDVAKMYLTKCYEVGNESFGSPKVQKIIDLKRELDLNKLLLYFPNFVCYLKTRKVIFYNCLFLNKMDEKMLDEITGLCEVQSINELNNDYCHKYIYEFDNIEDEVVYVASEICNLIQKGVNCNNIKLCGVSGEYPGIIKRIFEWYNIPISFSDSYLYSTKMAQDFLANLDESGSGALKFLEENYLLTDSKVLGIYNKIIGILNRYVWVNSYLEIRNFLEDEFKNTKINVVNYQEEVKIINSLMNVSDDDYVFLLGFNQGDIPKTFKDESYFNDILKQKFGLEITYDLNKRVYQKWLMEIKNTKNLIVTTKLNSSLGVHYLSSLNDELKMEIVRPKVSYSYSNLYNKLLLGQKIDNLIKYGEKEEDLDLLYSSYSELSYRDYSNEYQVIDKEKLKEYLNHRLVLSYSAMNSYYQCGFRYYLSNVLKLNVFEESFYTVLGNLFHYILSIALDKDIDFTYEYNNYLSKCDYSFNGREKFFLSILKDDLLFIINTIKKQNEVTSLNETYYEEKIEVDKSNKEMSIIFKGFVDKLMTDKYGNIVSIVDYKTGNPDLNLNNIIYGLDLQLPVYVYLARKKFPNAQIAGFYLQKILNNEISKDYKHTYETLKEDKLRLQGYSNSNISILEKFDSSYNESKLIKGMRTTSKGLGTKKILSDDQIKELENITENKIDVAIKGILDADFKVNPKRVGMDNLGCKYCEFKDICFCTEGNIETLKEYKNMEFLGGEDNDTEETE